jgi:hypothetical protein
MVNGLVEMHRGKYEASGTELVMGYGKFIGHSSIYLRGRIIAS